MNETLKVGTVGMAVYATPHVNAAGQDDPSLDEGPALVAAINATEHTLWISAYSWTLATVKQAVLDAHARGVVIRVVMDASEYHQANGVGPELLAAGVDLRVFGSQYILNHAKVMVFDGEMVFLGSYNFTTSAETGNQEVAQMEWGVNVVRTLAPLMRAHIDAAYARGHVPA